MPTRELAPTVEAKTAEAQKASEHETNRENAARTGFSVASLISQPGGSPSPRIQPVRLNQSNNSETSRSAHRVLQLQRRYGNRYVQKALNSGREADADTAATSGVGEATKESRTGGRSRDHLAGGLQGKYLKTNVPRIQAAWYNFSIPFTDYEFDPSIEGVKTAAGVAKDAVVDSAEWVKDKAVAGFEWVFDKIKDLVSSGIGWLDDKFSEIKEFATSSFDTVRNGLSSLLTHITAPLSLITSAFINMDADLLGTAWSALTKGAASVWTGIKSVIDGVLKIGSGLWNTVSEYVSSLIGAVNSIIDSWPFRQLPDFLQRKAKELLNDVRSLWQKVDDFISNTLKQLKAFTDDIVASIESFVQRVVSYGIKKVVDTVKAISAAWQFVKKIAADPIAFIRPTVDKLAAKLNAEAPPKAIELGQEKLQQNFKRNSSADAGDIVIQREPATTKPQRSTASFGEVIDGFVAAIKQAWGQLDIGKMLLDTLVNMFWPPATIRAIGNEFSELWNTDWANAVNALFAPRTDDFLGFIHDVWSNILVLLDFPLALWRRLNSVLMLLSGYVTIILIIIGAVAGGVLGAVLGGGAGVIPGAIAGAEAGLEMAASLGILLLKSYFLAEGASIVKALIDLFTARQTQAAKKLDYIQIAGSLIGMAVALLILGILWLLSSLIGALVRSIKGGKAPAAETTNPAVAPEPAESAKPAEPAKPMEPTESAEPAKPPEPAKPAEPIESPAQEAKPTTPKKTEPVSAVEGKPNTYKVNEASALKATEPSRIQGPKNQAFWHWKLYVELPNGQIAVFCEVNIRFRGSPDLNLHPKTAVVKGSPNPVLLERGPFGWTEESLRLMIDSYRKKFGHAPKNLGGWLAKDNLFNFQNEFARIRAQNPALSNQQIGQMAIKQISFGKQRMPFGYEHFYITILKVGKVTLRDGTTQVVPTLVRVEAGTSPISPSKLPPIKPPDSDELGSEEE